jgi:hypothetical protein
VGNSGADIAMDVAETHQTFLAGTESGVIPWRIEGAFGRNVMGRVMRFVGHRVLSIDTPIGRKARPAMLHRAAPLIRVKPQDLVTAGIVTHEAAMSASPNPAVFEVQIRGLPRRTPQPADRASSPPPAPIPDDLSSILPSD